MQQHFNRVIRLWLALAVSGHCAFAQTVHPNIPDNQLTKIIDDLDARQFGAFNTCDLENLTSLYAPDAEFYHDLNGRILNRDQFIAAVKKNICGKAQRRLIEGTTEIYPLAKIGALQMGRHCFYKVGATACIQQARFTMLWKYDGTHWQLSRVFSYDHKDVK